MSIADRIARSLQPEHFEPLVDEYTEEMERWGTRILRELGISTSFDMLNPRSVAHIRNLKLDKITGINNRTRSAVRRQLREAFNVGEGIDEMAARIGRVFDGTRGYRARRIARTEILAGSNFGTLDAYKQSGVVERKAWVNTPFGNFRPGHQALNDADSIPIGDNFVDPLTGDRGPHPGAMDSASGNINCRCTLIADVGDGKSFDHYTYWKAFDRRARTWERRFLRTFRKIATLQQQLIMRKVRESLA